MHPPLDECTISVTEVEHPITDGLQDFTVIDERYSHLETQPDVAVLCAHRFEDVTHPLVWSREAGPGRVIYDGLGHDVGSYDAPGHRALLVIHEQRLGYQRVLLVRVVEWLTAAR